MKTILLAIMLSVSPNGIPEREIRPIETIVATASMSVDDFAMSIRKRVSRLSHRESSEVCGAFYMKNGVLAVDLVTSKRDMECVMYKPDGFINVTIHTHPVTSPGLFSEHDYDAGEGYLVVTGNLYHQNGKGTVRKLR